MIIYPVPAAVTQAKVQLAIDETARAPSHQLAADLRNLLDTQNQAEREAMAAQAATLDRKA